MARQLRTFGSCLIVCLLLIPSVANAQEREPSIFGQAFKMAILDPTTWTPAIVTYDIEAIDIVRVNDQGQATDHWGITDLAGMMQQLGLVPSGPPPA